MATETIKCPHCGLALTLDKTVTGRSTLKYDVDAWQRLCRHPQLRSPALCLVERDDGAGRTKR